MQHPVANAAQSGGALCVVPMMVDPFVAEKSDATLRAITHGSSFQAPSAQPIESITRRFTSCTVSFDRSSKRSEQAYSASWWASVLVMKNSKLQSADESPHGNFNGWGIHPCSFAYSVVSFFSTCAY